MIAIPLTHGFATNVDDADAPAVSNWRWHVQLGSANYARRITRVEGRSVTVYLHRFLMDAPHGMDVDHIDGNGLNNQRSNLRVVTHAVNLWNRHRAAAGYSYRPKVGRWRAYIDHKGHRYGLGSFLREADAVLARSAGLAFLRGEPMPSGFDMLALPAKFRGVIAQMARPA